MGKNDKIKITLVILIFCAILTWFVSGGTFNAEGSYEAAQMTRAGIFDLFLATMYSIYYKIADVYYILVLGGVYGVLSKTNSYRKLIDKVVSLVKNKEHIFILISTFIMALITSFTSNILINLIFVPFIMTVILKTGKDRITAVSTAIGGMLIGVAGMTFGTFGVDKFISAFNLKYTQGLGFKIIFFVISYILYNLFTILHLNKQYKDTYETSYDMFTTEEFEEPKKKRYKTKIWPMLLMIILLAVVLIIAYIDWPNSFGITLFNSIESKFEKLSVRGIPFLYNLAGSTKAFGKWTDNLGTASLLLITTFIISKMNSMPFDDFLDHFKEGLSKIAKVALIYVLVYSIFVTISWYGWPTTLINLLIGKGNFNLFLLLLAGIICAFFFIENNYTGYLLGEYLSTTYASKAIPVLLIFNTTSALVMAISPTSMLLMLALTLLDVPYKSWLKFIWKYVLSFLLVTIIVLSILCYM